MANYCLCNNLKCTMNQNCKRYTIEKEENKVYIRFENICHNKNDYFYQIKMDTELVLKEEGGNDESNR